MEKDFKLNSKERLWPEAPQVPLKVLLPGKHCGLKRQPFTLRFDQTSLTRYCGVNA